MVASIGVTGSTPILNTNLAPSATSNGGNAATGEMSLFASNRTGKAFDGRTSVATRQGDGEATRPSHSDATTWMDAKFDESKAPNAAIEIGSGRQFELDGKTYIDRGAIGANSSGSVHRYVNKDDPHDLVALKVPHIKV